MVVALAAIGVAIALPDMGGLKDGNLDAKSLAMQVAIALPDMGGLKASI